MGQPGAVQIDPVFGEVMDWCDDNGIDNVFGLPGNAVLARGVEVAADDIRTRRAETGNPCLRGYTETRYGAKSWKTERRACARIEATTLGLDIRFVVTSLTAGSAEFIYDTLYCERGQAENLIKLHKAQLASDRTSCRSPLANQMRLVLHTAAYWLVLTLRDAIPKTHALAKAEFNIIRLRLLKLGARVIESLSRVRIAFAAACPEAPLIRHLAIALMPAGALTDGAVIAPRETLRPNPIAPTDPNQPDDRKAAATAHARRGKRTLYTIGDDRHE
jgi:hypothetical protein